MASSMVTPAMQAKAEKLAGQLATFSRGRSKRTGQAFYIVPGSKKGTAHWTALDGSGCTCQGFNGPRGTCTHVMAAQAVAQHLASKQQPAPAPKAPPTYANLFPVCAIDGCGEEAGRKGGLCIDHIIRSQRVAA